VDALLFDQKLQGVRVCDVGSGEAKELTLDGLFISIGRSPATTLFQGQLALDEHGYIVADETTSTSVDGVFAAGDCADPDYKQAVSAAGTGAQAALEVQNYLGAVSGTAEKPVRS
jgi:thioredoxin reductase (NADPH)